MNGVFGGGEGFPLFTRRDQFCGIRRRLHQWEDFHFLPHESIFAESRTPREGLPGWTFFRVLLAGVGEVLV